MYLALVCKLTIGGKIIMATLTQLNDWDKDHGHYVKSNQVLKYSGKKITKAEAKKDSRLTAGDTIPLYFNMSTGDYGRFLSDVVSADDYADGKYVIHDRLDRNDNYQTLLPYMEYVPEFESVFFAFYRISLWHGRGESFAPRTFYVSAKFFVDKQKNVYESSPRTGHKFNQREDSTQALIDYINWVNSGVGAQKSVNGEPFGEYSKPLIRLFGPIANVGANNTIPLDRMYEWPWFFNYKEPIIKHGKKSKRIEELVSSFPLRSIPYDPSIKKQSVAYIEKIEDGLAVIRTMENIEDFDGNMVDKARIYVTKDEVVSCRPTNSGEWVPMVLRSNIGNWDFSIYEFDRAFVKGTKLEYFAELIEELDPKARTSFLASVLGFPWIEAIAKTGMLKVLASLLSKNYEKAGDLIYSFFGGINKDAKKAYDIMGLNKHQIGRIAEFLGKIDSLSSHYQGISEVYIIRYMKSIFAPDHDKESTWLSSADMKKAYPSIQDVDNETFDIAFDAVTAAFCVNEYSQSDMAAVAYSLHLLRTTYSKASMVNNIDNILNVRSKVKEITITKSYPLMGGAHRTFKTKVRLIDYINDYYNIVRKMGDTAHFRPKFDPDDEEQIVNMHDAATAVYNTLEGKSESMSFGSSEVAAEAKKLWQKWTYEEDEYSVIYPESLGEIALEGIELHHCAKLYVEKVASRSTNVLFIRRTDELDTPFYTVEIDNSGHLLQIAGFANYYPSGNRPLLDFVDRWCKRRRITNTIKL